MPLILSLAAFVLAVMVVLAFSKARKNNIKELTHSMEDARNSAFMLRNIIDSTPDPIFIKDVNHRFTMVNEAYCALTHLRADQVIGKTDIEVGVPEDIVKGNPEKGIRGYWEDDNEVMRTGNQKLIPEEIFSVNGELSYFRTLKVPL
jgi:PAS domain-containing protein